MILDPIVSPFFSLLVVELFCFEYFNNLLQPSDLQQFQVSFVQGLLPQIVDVQLQHVLLVSDLFCFVDAFVVRLARVEPQVAPQLEQLPLVRVQNHFHEVV